MTRFSMFIILTLDFDAIHIFWNDLEKQTVKYFHN